MPHFVTLSRADSRPLFSEPRLYPMFLDRLRVLTERWDATLLAYALEPERARLLLAGEAVDIAHVVRLQQSGWGVWRHYRRDYVEWAPSVREEVPRSAVRQGAVFLHRDVGLAWPWSSLWEVVELRTRCWTDPSWLGDARRHLARVDGQARYPESPAPGWRSPRLDWSVIEQAVLHVTGRPAGHRANRVLRTQLGWVGGWSANELAGRLRVSPRAVSRCLRRERQVGWREGRILLSAPHLSAGQLPGGGRWLRTGGLEEPCPATVTSSPVLAK